MNLNGQTTLQRIFLLTAGAACGAIVGYTISELVVDRIIFGPLERPEEKKNDGIVGVDYSELEKEFAGTKKIPYGSKPSLDELTRDYRPAEPIRIVDFHDRLGEDVETIYYYEKDQTFAYESEDIVDDPNGLFVKNVHLHFGEGSPDPDIVYVQNDDLDLIYEIIRKDEYYKVSILGEPDPDAITEKKPPVKRKRRVASPKKEKLEELTDELHETDGKA
jgi:hypothetical protein